MKPIILYLSISGNPPHLGHISALNQVVTSLTKHGRKVEKIYISLAVDQYISHKLENLSDSDLSKNIHMNLDDRCRFLQEIIKDARNLNMLKNLDQFHINVEIAGMNGSQIKSENNGGHRSVYEHIAQVHQNNCVLFVAGQDTEEVNKSWARSPSKNPIYYAAIVQRVVAKTEPNKAPFQRTSYNTIDFRWDVLGDSEYGSVSSTDIRRKTDCKGLGPLSQTFWQDWLVDNCS
jgi:nicotinic acid mononucleotide adenylyltransferase